MFLARISESESEIHPPSWSRRISGDCTSKTFRRISEYLSVIQSRAHLRVLARRTSDSVPQRSRRFGVYVLCFTFRRFPGTVSVVHRSKLQHSIGKSPKSEHKTYTATLRKLCGIESEVLRAKSRRCARDRLPINIRRFSDP